MGDRYRSQLKQPSENRERYKPSQNRSRSRSPRRTSEEPSPPPKETNVKLKLKSGENQSKSKPKMTVANVFNQESDEEPEMPPEAKMRMRNIGRDTPTSAGPNSFGKTKHGFCDAKKVFEKNLKDAMNEAAKDD